MRKQYLLHILVLIVAAAESYNTPECPLWPSSFTWHAELGSLLSRDAQLHGPIDPNSFYAECTTLGTDAYAINKAGNGICMHVYACAYEFCRPDAEKWPQLDLPAYVVEAKTPDDISRAIEFASRHDIEVSVKTTGHSYQGSSTAASSLLIWMQNYPKDGTITRSFQDSCGTRYDAAVGIGGGEVWDDVIAAVRDDYHIVTGGARSVSAAGGWLQGVGLSFSSRRYGTGVDNVLDFDVVLADGRHVRADACTNPDLFWALRGGGGGTFGVVTHVHYKLHPKTQITVIDWKLRFGPPQRDSDFDFASQWLAYWIKVSPKLDDRWSGFWHPFGVHLVFAGSQSAAEVTFINDFENWYFTKLDRTGLNKLPNPKRKVEVFPSWFHYIGGDDAQGNPDATVATGDEHVGVEFLGARLMPKYLVEQRPDEVLAFLMNLLTIDYAYVHYFLGGQINAVDEGSTAVHPAMRNAVWAVHWESDSATQLVRDFLPNSITGASFNHHQTTEPYWTEALWGKNYFRLLHLKNKYDPNRVFNCWHCVGYQGREFGEPRDFVYSKNCPALSPSAKPGSNEGLALEMNCFASDVQVKVLLLNADTGKDNADDSESQTVVTKTMKDLRVGDNVLVNDRGQFEPIYAFGHYDPDLPSTYLKFSPSGLKLSRDHMVFIRGSRAPIPALTVKVGDVLWTAEDHGQGEAVTWIDIVVQKGAYAPFTSSGTIVVNGVQASTFVALQESATLVIGGGGGIQTGITHQWMARTFELPHKWYVGATAATTTYSTMAMTNNNPKGISSWVSGPLAFAEWWLKGEAKNALIMFLVALPVVSFLAFLASLECIVLRHELFLFMGFVGIGAYLLKTCVAVTGSKRSKSA